MLSKNVAPFSFTVAVFLSILLTTATNAAVIQRRYFADSSCKNQTGERTLYVAESTPFCLGNYSGGTSYSTSLSSDKKSFTIQEFSDSSDCTVPTTTATTTTTIYIPPFNPLPPGHEEPPGELPDQGGGGGEEEEEEEHVTQAQGEQQQHAINQCTSLGEDGKYVKYDIYDELEKLDSDAEGYWRQNFRTPDCSQVPRYGGTAEAGYKFGSCRKGLNELYFSNVTAHDNYVLIETYTDGTECTGPSPQRSVEFINECVKTGSSSSQRALSFSFGPATSESVIHISETKAALAENCHFDEDLLKKLLDTNGCIEYWRYWKAGGVPGLKFNFFGEFAVNISIFKASTPDVFKPNQALSFCLDGVTRNIVYENHIVPADECIFFESAGDRYPTLNGAIRFSSAGKLMTVAVGVAILMMMMIMIFILF